MRTIEHFEEYLEPIESVLFDKFVPALFGGEKPTVPNELLALNPKEGGLGLENPKWNAKINTRIQKQRRSYTQKQ